jgi:hypothetical protein
VTASGEPDEAADREAARSITLSRVSDASGQLEVTPVPTPDGQSQSSQAGQAASRWRERRAAGGA